MVSSDVDKFLPDPENYAKCFHELFKNLGDVQRYNLQRFVCCSLRSKFIFSGPRETGKKIRRLKARRKRTRKTRLVLLDVFISGV